MSEVYTENTYFLAPNYGDNRVVLLAKDPHCLFAYWEVSSAKKDDFIKEFGKEIWDKSVPVLKVTNVSKNNSFFVRINDFSSSWYINVDDSDSLYIAELGRKVSEHFFINLASSNYITTPGNSVNANASAFFVNYKDLRDGKIDLAKIHTNTGLNIIPQIEYGLSSPELYGINLHEAISGVSSEELLSINITENPVPFDRKNF